MIENTLGFALYTEYIVYIIYKIIYISYIIDKNLWDLGLKANSEDIFVIAIN